MISSHHHWCIWGWMIIYYPEIFLDIESLYGLTSIYQNVENYNFGSYKWSRYWVYLEANNTTWHYSSFSHTQTYTKITCNYGSWSIEEQPNHQHITKHKHNQINEMFSWRQIMSRSINLNYASMLNNWIYILILHNNLTKQIKKETNNPT